MIKTLMLGALSALAIPTIASAQTADVSDYGTACGLTATGSIEPNGNSRRLTLTCQGRPRTTVLFMVSGARLDPGIPLTPLGSSCELLLDTIPFSQTHQTDADGNYTFSKALGQIYPIDSYVQFLTIEFNGSGFDIDTSNGLRVTYL